MLVSPHFLSHMASKIPHADLHECWVCSSCDSIHHHHIVPRHCGGTNGPTVPLCGNCHSRVHKVGSNFHKILKEDHVHTDDLTEYVSDLYNANRVVYLAAVIHDAEKLTKKSINKKSKLMLTFTAEERKMLKLLSKTIKKSQEKTLIASMKFMHSKICGTME